MVLAEHVGWYSYFCRKLGLIGEDSSNDRKTPEEHKTVPSICPPRVRRDLHLRSLQVTDNGNRFVLVNNDLFLHLTRSIQMPTPTALKVAEQFLDHCTGPYRAPDYLLSDNCPPFVAKLSKEICAFLQLNLLTTTA